MKHFASAKFWRSFDRLPKPVQALARTNIDLLKSDSKHPSLHFKKVGKYHSIRIGIHHRALATEAPDGLVWFWIGPHSEYDQLIRT